jgi:hypothetical protein
MSTCSRDDLPDADVLNNLGGAAAQGGNTEEIRATEMSQTDSES